MMPNGYGSNIGTDDCGPVVPHSGGVSAKLRAGLVQSLGGHHRDPDPERQPRDRDGR